MEIEKHLNDEVIKTIQKANETVAQVTTIQQQYQKSVVTSKQQQNLNSVYRVIASYFIRRHHFQIFLFYLFCFV